MALWIAVLLVAVCVVAARVTGRAAPAAPRTMPWFAGRRQALTTSTVIGNCTSLCSFTGT